MSGLPPNGDTGIAAPPDTPAAAALAEGDYERPQQGWQCGHGNGTRCRLGPDRRGRCRAGAVCRPRRDGDRWHCTRPADLGGPCDKGPGPDGSCGEATPPCSPRASLRTLRGRAVQVAVVAMVGFLLIALHGSGRDRLVSPGAVNLRHGTIADCATCHGGYDAGPTAWLLAAVSTDARHRDSELCLDCHGLGDHPFRPHAQPPAELAALTAARLASPAEPPRPPVGLAVAARLFAPETDRLACRTCHHEHSGVASDLTAMTDEACQTCHARPFAALARGHPPIDQVLSDRRMRLKFDHNAHFGRYFDQATAAVAAPRACTDCHALGATGRDMIVRGFDAACAACHRAEITAAAATGRAGIPVLTAPGLDLFEFEARGVEIGGWPEFSEEPLTPFMEVLLRRAPAVADALDRLAGADLLDLRDADADRLDAAARVAVAIKRLIAEVRAEGLAPAAPTLTEIMAAAPAQQPGDLFALLPFDVIDAARKDWFPTLAQDLHRSLPTRTAPAPNPAAAPADDEIDAGGAMDQGDILAGSDGGLDHGDILGLPTDPDHGDILGLSADPDQGDILGLSADPDQGDILGLPADPDQGDILGLSADPDQGDILGPPAGLLADPTRSLADPDAAPPVAALPEPIEPDRWAAMGGWYRQDQALVYRPTGHADRFLRAWLDVAAAHAGDAADHLGRRLMAAIGTARAPGRCMRCHSLDAAPPTGNAAPASRVNWLGARLDPRVRTFTHFRHADHFSLVEGEGCAHCHRLTGRIDPEAFDAQFQPPDPRAASVADFDGPKVETCAGCHTPDAAGDACTLCHRYHIGRVSPRLPTTETRPMP